MKKINVTKEEMEFINWIRAMSPDDREDLKDYLKELLTVKAYRRCPMCGKEGFIEVDQDKLILYENRVKNIQEIFPELDNYEREYLITGYCPDCQKLLFGAKEYKGDKIILL